VKPLRRVLEWLQRHWAIVVPTTLALACFSLRGVSGTPDTAWYLVAALNLAEARGLVDTDGSPVVTRGPVFPGSS